MVTWSQKIVWLFVLDICIRENTLLQWVSCHTPIGLGSYIYMCVCVCVCLCAFVRVCVINTIVKYPIV